MPVPSHFSRVLLFVTLWTAARQAPLSVGFSRQECWSGLPCPPVGDLPDPGIELMSLQFPALAGEFYTTSTTWKALYIYTYRWICMTVPGLSWGTRDLQSLLWHVGSISWPRMEPGPLRWECGVLATGPPGKSQRYSFKRQENVGISHLLTALCSRKVTVDQRVWPPVSACFIILPLWGHPYSCNPNITGQSYSL